MYWFFQLSYLSYIDFILQEWITILSPSIIWFYLLFQCLFLNLSIILHPYFWRAAGLSNLFIATTAWDKIYAAFGLGEMSLKGWTLFEYHPLCCIDHTSFEFFQMYPLCMVGQCRFKKNYPQLLYSYLHKLMSCLFFERCF